MTLYSKWTKTETIFKSTCIAQNHNARNNTKNTAYDVRGTLITTKRFDFTVPLTKLLLSLQNIKVVSYNQSNEELEMYIYINYLLKQWLI